MVSTENTIIGACLLVALVAAYLLEGYASLPDWIAMAALFGLGIVVPTAINEYRYRSAGSRSERN